MTSASRKFLLIFFIVIFCAAAPTLILYSQGYRINFPYESGSKLLVKTGGLFIKASPKQAEVYVNGKLAERTDFFFGSVLVENLFPKNYLVEVKKDGYWPWQKTLPISEMAVTEVKTIVLVPQNLDFAPIAQGFENFWVSPDAKKIILKSSGTDGWTIKLFDAEKSVESKIFSESDISRKGVTLDKIAWSGDSRTADVFMTSENTGIRRTVNVEKNPARVTLYTVPQDIATTTIAYKKTNGTLYYLDQDGFAYKKELLSKDAAQMNKQPLPVTAKTDPEIWVIAGNVFIDDNNALWRQNAKTGEFDKIFDNPENGIEISPDSKKIAYFSNSEIWISYLEDKPDAPARKAGDTQFIARMSQNIRDCHWFDNNYLVFSSGDTIKIAEIDNRDKINIIDAATFSQITGASEDHGKARIFWDADTKFLYTIDNSTVYRGLIE